MAIGFSVTRGFKNTIVGLFALAASVLLQPSARAETSAAKDHAQASAQVVGNHVLIEAPLAAAGANLTSLEFGFISQYKSDKANAGKDFWVLFPGTRAKNSFVVVEGQPYERVEIAQAVYLLDRQGNVVRATVGANTFDALTGKTFNAETSAALTGDVKNAFVDQLLSGAKDANSEKPDHINGTALRRALDKGLDAPHATVVAKEVQEKAPVVQAPLSSSAQEVGSYLLVTAPPLEAGENATLAELKIRRLYEKGGALNPQGKTLWVAHKGTRDWDSGFVVKGGRPYQRVEASGVVFLLDQQGKVAQATTTLGGAEHTYDRHTGTIRSAATSETLKAVVAKLNHAAAFVNGRLPNQINQTQLHHKLDALAVAESVRLDAPAALASVSGEAEDAWETIHIQKSLKNVKSAAYSYHKTAGQEGRYNVLLDYRGSVSSEAKTIGAIKRAVNEAVRRVKGLTVDKKAGWTIQFKRQPAERKRYQGSALDRSDRFNFG